MNVFPGRAHCQYTSLFYQLHVRVCFPADEPRSAVFVFVTVSVSQVVHWEGPRFSCCSPTQSPQVTTGERNAGREGGWLAGGVGRGEAVFLEASRRLAPMIYKWPRAITRLHCQMRTGLNGWLRKARISCLWLYHGLTNKQRSVRKKMRMKYMK